MIRSEPDPDEEEDTLFGECEDDQMLVTGKEIDPERQSFLEERYAPGLLRLQRRMGLFTEGTGGESSGSKAGLDPDISLEEEFGEKSADQPRQMSRC